jgi:phosphoribosyl 1,2-cyclic phosphodiesterase
MVGLGQVVLPPPSPPAEAPRDRALTPPPPPYRPLQYAFDFEPAPAPTGPPLRVVVLGSGSGGNAVVVESGDHRILIDAGFSSRELSRRMKEVDCDPKSLGAIVLTHEHLDHCRGVNRFARRHELPVYATSGTVEGADFSDFVSARTHVLRSGEEREVAGFRIAPFALPHDAREPIGLVVEDASGRRVGLVADCGSRSQLAWGRLREVELLILETNHDLEMLRSGPYPWSLKQRVAGRHGHLSNREAAEGLDDLVHDGLQWIVLYHLSRTNNLPALAAAAVGGALDRCGCRAGLVVSEQDQPTAWMEVK